MTRETVPFETILEPDLPIIDAHHHLFVMPEAALKGMEGADAVAAKSLAPTYRRHARYLLDEFLADLKTGHNIRATVFADCYAMYRSTGPDHLKSVGEVEFVNGVAAVAESGLFGDIKVCAGIVGGVDLRLGDAVEEVLLAQRRAGGARYRGIRGAGIIFDEDASILGGGTPQVLRDAKFREGFKWLQPLGLSFDVLVLEPQLPDLIDLARAFPETQIVLNHVGVPVGVGRYAGQRDSRFALWRENMGSLARCPNVAVKLGGLGMPFAAFESFGASPPASSAQLAAHWKPYIETCIETFGANRCMFESNFPVDAATCSYATLWNAFKRIAAGASQDEKTALFSGTAARIYRLEI